MSKIEWTNKTWNPTVGCSLESPGCTNCYAMSMAGRLALISLSNEAKGIPDHFAHYRELTTKTKTGYVWTGKINLASDAKLLEPLTWKAGLMIFVDSMSDLFHPNVPFEVVDQVWAVMALGRHHIFQVLTKRPDRMREYLTSGREHLIVLAMDGIMRRRLYLPYANPISAAGDLAARRPLPNVWCGTSVEDQTRADERVPTILQTPAAVRWLSLEPLLGPINLTGISTMRFRGAEVLNALTGQLSGTFGDECATQLPKLDWLVAGGESGPRARPWHPSWARTIRDHALRYNVPFLWKQNGAWLPDDQMLRAGTPIGKTTKFHRFDDDVRMNNFGKKRSGRHLDGKVWDEYPRIAA